MNWAAISTIAEVVGATGVIAGLVYVAVQIRQNTQSLRINTFASSNRGVQQFHRTLIQDPELLRVFFAGHEDFDALDRDDRLRFHGLMMDWLLEYQLFRHSFSEGAQSAKSFAGRSLGEFERHVISMLRTPGGQAWWRGETYINPETRVELNALMAAHPDVRFRSGDPYLGLDRPPGHQIDG